MVNTLSRILTVALIVVFIGIGVLWITLPDTDTPSPGQDNRQQDVGNNGQEPLQKSEPGVSEGPETPDGRDGLDDPERLLKAAQSPDFEEFMRKSGHTANPVAQYFSSQGLGDAYEGYLDTFTKGFQEQFPGEDAADLEPYMRERLAALAAEHKASLAEGEGSETEIFEDVLVKFIVEEQSVPWIMTYFEGDFFQASRWASDILQTPVQLPTDTASPPPAIPQEPGDSDASTVDIIAPQDEPTDPPTAVEALQPNGDNNRVDPDAIPRLLDFEGVTQEQVETALRQEFSPERFNRALQTLNRQGPEAGMRALKESDPEIAKALERFIQPREGDR